MAGTSEQASAALADILSGGSEADLKMIEHGPAKGIGFLMRANNEQQQALIRVTILELISKNDEGRKATHAEFDRKVDEVKQVITNVNDARMQSERDRLAHEGALQAEVAKAEQLRTELADLDLKMIALNSDVMAGTACTQHELTELLSKSRTDFDRLAANVRGEFVKVRGEMSEAASGMGFKPRGDKPQGLVDSRDFKVSMMPESCNAEQFKKWRHDALVVLEAHPNWAGAKKVLGCVRKAVRVVDTDIMRKTILDANSECEEETGSYLTDPDGWNFLDRSRELYQLLSVKLNSSAFADFKDEDNMNGFELWRQLNKSKDPIRQDVAFHLELAIQSMASTRETNFESTYNRMLEIDKASKNYKHRSSARRWTSSCLRGSCTRSPTTRRRRSSTGTTRCARRITRISTSGAKSGSTRSSRSRPAEPRFDHIGDPGARPCRWAPSPQRPNRRLKSRRRPNRSRTHGPRGRQTLGRAGRVATKDGEAADS